MAQHVSRITVNRMRSDPARLLTLEIADLLGHLPILAYLSSLLLRVCPERVQFGVDLAADCSSMLEQETCRGSYIILAGV